MSNYTRLLTRIINPKQEEEEKGKRNIETRSVQSWPSSIQNNLLNHPITSSSSSSSLASGHQMAPKLVQFAKDQLMRYYEGSTLILSCSLAITQMPGSGPLKFTWFKQQQQQQQLQSSLSKPLSPNQRLSIETLNDYSLLKLTDLRASDSGQYTCSASNSNGQEDRTTAQVIVNGKFGSKCLFIHSFIQSTTTTTSSSNSSR